jgi:hypothetical protein
MLDMDKRIKIIKEGQVMFQKITAVNDHSHQLYGEWVSLYRPEVNDRYTVVTYRDFKDGLDGRFLAYNSGIQQISDDPSQIFNHWDIDWNVFFLGEEVVYERKEYAPCLTYSRWGHWIYDYRLIDQPMGCVDYVLVYEE